MHPGDVVANRFEIERFAGAGGMGAVYRAADRETGAAVALKVLTRGSTERFLREARVLAELAHPRIVRHVAHGTLPSGDPWLAMEWLDGEELARRLERGPLPIADSVAVARAVAEALSAAHARGVVHRDLKPTNLFLEGGDVARLRVLDFGAARVETQAAPTATGIVLGTPGYMAPEQVRGDRPVDARADVFSLGCVLFECLTGRPAFVAQHVLALLGKVLLEEPPPLHERVADAPAALEELLRRMLSKDPEARPAGGAELLAAIDALGSLAPPSGAARTTPPSRAHVTERERRLVTIVMAAVPDDARVGESVRARARDVAGRFGAQVGWAGEGSMIVVLTAKGTARDQAAAAARCALAISGELPGAQVVVATGRGEISTVLPIGEVMERAATLLASGGAEGGRVRLDEATAALLDARFEIQRGEGAEGLYVLAGERVSETVRAVLGRPSPCVGRDKELALLTATYDECASERSARTVLIVGEAGLGKSRLRHEVCARLRAAAPELEILVAQADAVAAGSPLGLARQLVARSAGVHETDAPSSRRARIASRLRGRIPTGDEGWMIDFLAELLGGEPDAPASDQLRAARGDPTIMSVWLRRAFEGWLEAECAQRPLAIVLDDLHWGDAASVALLGGALLRMRERPLFVLALARPEVRPLFPQLWAGLDVQTIQLVPLSRAASERLVRSVLGDGVARDTVARVVERAGGNAFFLEELVRHTAGQGDAAELPATVLAMIESRIGRLDAPSRRTLRAASVFGRTLWAGGVRALLGGGILESVVADLDALVAAELLVPAAGARFAGEREYAFRHDLVRDTALAMLTPEDATAAQRLAGEWLEAAGERDPLVLAGHFERGAAPERAVAWLVRAARDASQGRDAAGVHALVRRGVALGASGETLGRLRLFDSLAFIFEDRMPDAEDSARQAVHLVPTADADWALGASMYAFAAMHTGNLAAVMEVTQALVQAGLDAWGTGPAGSMCATVVIALVWAGQRDAALDFLRRLDAVQAEGADAAFLAWRLCARGYVHLFLAEDLAAPVRDLTAAVAIFERVGDAWGLANCRGFLAFALTLAGDVEGGVAMARSALATTSSQFVQHQFRGSLGGLLVAAGRHDEAFEIADAVVRELHPVAAHTPRAALSSVLLHRGDADGAEREARVMIEFSAGLPFATAIGHAVLACAAMLRGRPAQALREADESLRLLASSFELRPWSIVARNVRAEALLALGDAERARDAIRETMEQLGRLAGTLATLAEKERFFAVEWHARARALARERLS